MRNALSTGTSALLVVMIMFIGSLGLWIGTPLLWLWVGSQVQGAGASLSAAFAVMLIGVILSIALLAMLLAKLSDIYRANRISRGGNDPGHLILEGVLVVSAGITLVAFAIWFLLFAGASPMPIGVNL